MCGMAFITGHFDDVSGVSREKPAESRKSHTNLKSKCGRPALNRLFDF